MELIHPFWFNFLELQNFWKCVGVWFSKSPNVYILLRWSFSYAKLRLLIWFHINPRIFNPRNFHFSVGFYSKLFFPSRPQGRHRYQKMWNFIAHLLIYVKSLSHHIPLLKRPRKRSKVNFPWFFQGNRFELGIIGNIFQSSTFWAIQN